MINWPFLPYGIEPLVLNCPEPSCPSVGRRRKMFRNRPNISRPYDARRIKPSMDNYMDELFTPKYVDKYEPEKSIPHRASPLVLLDDKKDKVTINDDKFTIRLNTDGYTPKELSVKTTDNFILVEGHHEEMSPKSQVSRSFSKKWAIPDRVEHDEIFSFINSNTGDLLIEGPRVSDEDKVVEKMKPMHINDGKSPKVHFDLPEDVENLNKNNNKNPESRTRKESSNNINIPGMVGNVPGI